jgi:hypothetical protein
MFLNLRTPTRLRAGLCLGIALFAAVCQAGASSFCGGLSPEERASSGIAGLTPAQSASLDTLVGRDVSLAREGGVTAFSTTFTARLTAQERTDCGIGSLDPIQRAKLDSLAARAIALGPPPEDAFTYAPKPTPAPQKSTAGGVLSAIGHMDVHGDLSFTVGGGSHGSSLYGTSMDAFATDPSGTFTIGVGFDDYRGKGLFLPIAPIDPADPFYFGIPWLDR